MTERELEGVRLQLSMQSQQAFGRMTVWSLMRHIEALDWDVEAYIKAGKREMEANDRLTNIVIKLEREKKELVERLETGEKLLVEGVEINDRLKRCLEDLQRQRKVAVPQEVAEALEYFRNNSTANQTVLRSIENVRCIGPFATTLRNFSKSNFDRLLAAMINGYTTVEQTPEERIGMKISSMLFAMNIETPIPVDQLAKQLTTMLQDEIAESSKSTI